MKFGLDAPYTKTMKKSKRGNRITAVDQPLGASHSMENQSSQIWSNKISINCKVYVLSEKYKNHTETLPQFFLHLHLTSS